MSGDEKLSELVQKMQTLRGRLADLEAEAERWRAERDRLNELVKGIRTEALKHREERDSANGQVAEIKQKMESLRVQLKDKRFRLAEIDAKLEEERRRLPSRRKLAGRLGRIEWEMMTTPTVQMLGREKDLIEETKGLGKGLAAHEELDGREDEELVMLADIKALELELQGFRNEIGRLRELSGGSHERMILLRQKADEEKKRSDEAHARFTEQLQAKRAVLAELNEVQKQAGELRAELRELKRLEAAGRGKTLEERKREVQAEAKRKLESGERFSFDELKLIYENEEEKEG